MITIDTIGIILLSGLALCFLLQMVYYWVFLNKPLRYQKKINKGIVEFSTAKPSVSVIICAENESENLLRYLPSILEQNYPQYEVIIVNYGSTESSDEALDQLEKQYKHLYRTYIPEESKYLSRKKLAMMVGIKAAKYDVLLFTEANCEPVSKDWISLMARHIEQKKSIVLGFNAFSKSTGFFTKYAAYDFFFNGLRMISMALLNYPYSGTGRNLAYKKDLFYEQKGFSKFMNLQSGEDDLFVNQVATKENVQVEMTSDSQTITHPDGLYDWKEIKIKKASTQRYYKSGPVAFWRLELYVRYGFIGLFFASIIYGLPGLILPIVAGTLFLIRLFSQLFVINQTAKYLRVEKFYFTLPLFDFLQPVFDLYFYIYRLFRGKKEYTCR